MSLFMDKLPDSISMIRENKLNAVQKKNSTVVAITK